MHINKFSANALACRTVSECQQSVAGFFSQPQGDDPSLVMNVFREDPPLLTEARSKAKKDIKALLEKIGKECGRIEPQIAKLQKKWSEERAKIRKECGVEQNNMNMAQSLCSVRATLGLDSPAVFHTNAIETITEAQKVAIEYGIYDDLVPKFDKARARLEKLDKAIDKANSKDQHPGFPVKNVP